MSAFDFPLRHAIGDQLAELACAMDGPLLGLDTSSAVTSWCLVRAEADSEHALDEQFLPAGVVPSESLVQSLDMGLRARALTASALKAIVVGIGPGSFTGLRVGLATIKGLAFGAQVPVIGVSSLGLWAAGAGAVLDAEGSASHHDDRASMASPRHILTLLDARRGDVFAALYRVQADGHVDPLIEDGVFTPDDLRAQLEAPAMREQLGSLRTGALPMVCVGDGAPICRDIALRLQGRWIADVAPRAALGLWHARSRLLKHAWDDLNTLTPRYLRLSEAERQLLGTL